MKNILQKCKVPDSQWHVAKFVLAVAICSMPFLAHASVESSLGNIQDRLINTILPLCGIIGLAIGGIRLVMGSGDAKSNLMMAVLGVGLGFGAPSLISFVRALIN